MYHFVQLFLEYNFIDDVESHKNGHNNDNDDEPTPLPTKTKTTKLINGNNKTLFKAFIIFFLKFLVSSSYFIYSTQANNLFKKDF